MIDTWFEPDCEDPAKIKLSFKEYEDIMEHIAECKEDDYERS